MLNQLTIAEVRQKLDAGEISSVDLTKACLKQIISSDEVLHACLLVDEEGALMAATEADKRLADGKKGALLGIPYLAKDNILTKNLRTTAGSKMLADYEAPYDATIIARLKAEGAVLLGKTNLDEFAHGSSTETSYFGPTKNPFDLSKTPGGSSGGSAAVVAADMCLFALGTDTGGSIRHPAGFCGVVGLKPTYGRCSRFGLVSMTSSTDVPGVLTKTPYDASLVLETLAGFDVHDSTSVKLDSELYHEAEADFKNLRIGVPAEFMDNSVAEPIKEGIRKAIKTLEALGATVLEVSLPHAHYGVSVYYIITPSEVSSNLARFDGIRYGHRAEATGDWLERLVSARGEGFGAETKRRIMLGTYTLSAGYYDAYYLQAQKVRTLIAKDFIEAFANVDIILAPTTPKNAFNLGEQSKDPLQMYLEDVFLTPASLAGIPAVAMPSGWDGNLPISLQLMANNFNEGRLLAVAQKLYEALAIKKRPVVC